METFNKIEENIYSGGKNTMNIVIEIYILVCISLLIFDIAFLIVKNYKGRRKFNPRKNRLKHTLETEFKKYTPESGLSDYIKNYLLNKAGITKNLVILQSIIENITLHRDEILSEIKPYILNQIDNYATKNEYEKAYYAHFVSLFNYQERKPDEAFYAKFLNFLESKSLYTFSNTMTAFYSFYDPYALMQAIKKSDEKEGFYHSKLLIDGLLEYKGDLKTLRDLILDNFYSYTSLTQESLITYFRQKELDVSEFCLNLLNKKDINDEVRYAAMRYFIKFPHDKATDVFISILENDSSNWIEQHIAIQGLKDLNNNYVRLLIKKKVTNKNWFIRINAISYLHKHHINRDEIYDILYLKDKYTNNALLYFYKNDKEMSRYIINTIQMLDLGEDEVAASENKLLLAMPGMEGGL